ncbi:MAG: DUF3619 family protein [Rubrivivax sp.]|nr:DUF3619 family protein [Rubrivivax sp.]
MRPSTTLHDSEVLQTRLAARLAAGLGEQAAALPHDISERLRVARQQAVEQGRLSRQRLAAARKSSPLATSVSVLMSPGAAFLAGPPDWWQRVASLLPLLILVAGLVGIENWTTHTQVLAAADIDAVLLADDVPPIAYTDPGFVEFLKDVPH